jgi:hypothetical protein
MKVLNYIGLPGASPCLPATTCAAAPAGAGEYALRKWVRGLPGGVFLRARWALVLLLTWVVPISYKHLTGANFIHAPDGCDIHAVHYVAVDNIDPVAFVRA